MIKAIEQKKAATFPVYLQKMAGFLMYRGFVLVDIAPNNKTPNKNVFFFRESAEIQEAISDYLSKS